MPAPPGQPEPRDRRLGAFPQFDPRSRAFTMRAFIDSTPPKLPRSYTWGRPVQQLDQGNVGACVGFSLSGEYGARPKSHPVNDAMGLATYHLAQTVDEWPGEAYEGTSLLGGIKAAIARAYYPQPTLEAPTYRWIGAGSGRALEDLVITVGYYGPVVVATNWHRDMFNPMGGGFIHPTGLIDGRHAYLIRGVTLRWPSSVLVASRSFDNLDLDASVGRILNSWGSWGINGEALISLRELDALLQASGEGCVIIRRN